MSGRTYLFAAGGTGGHLFPGIAVAECLMARLPDARVVFVGSDRPVERDILAATPFERRMLPEFRLTMAKRNPPAFAARLWKACHAASALIAKLRADAVIGCGGFASVAPVLAARRRGVPRLLLEQNVIPGRATRWLSRLGGTVCLTYAETGPRLPKSARYLETGNPVRRAIAELSQHERQAAEASRRTLLVLGGSQGARQVNDVMIAIAAGHPDMLDDWRIVHQTGAADEKRIREAYRDREIDARVSAFFTDPAALYREATVVISRAGGTTLAELACAGLPALLLPYPQAADDHQRKNAEVFQKAGAAVIVDASKDDSSTANAVAMKLRPLLDDENLRERMQSALASLARPDAATAVAKLLEAFPPSSGSATMQNQINVRRFDI